MDFRHWHAACIIGAEQLQEVNRVSVAFQPEQSGLIIVGIKSQKDFVLSRRLENKLDEAPLFTKPSRTNGAGIQAIMKIRRWLPADRLLWLQVVLAVTIWTRMTTGTLRGEEFINQEDISLIEWVERPQTLIVSIRGNNRRH